MFNTNVRKEGLYFTTYVEVLSYIFTMCVLILDSSEE